MRRVPVYAGGACMRGTAYAVRAYTQGVRMQGVCIPCSRFEGLCTHCCPCRHCMLSRGVCRAIALHCMNMQRVHVQGRAYAVPYTPQPNHTQRREYAVQSRERGIRALALCAADMLSHASASNLWCALPWNRHMAAPGGYETVDPYEMMAEQVAQLNKATRAMSVLHTQLLDQNAKVCLTASTSSSVVNAMVRLAAAGGPGAEAAP